MPSIEAKSFSTIEEFANHLDKRWKDLGWVIHHDKCTLTFHRQHKNGRPLKTSDIELTHNPFTSDLIFDGEKVIETNVRARLRPWTLYARNTPTQTFTNIEAAQLAVLKLAEQLAPTI